MDKSETKACVQNILSFGLDDILDEIGLKRRKGTFTYKRKTPESFQKIVFSIAHNPPYAPGAIAHIIPMLELQFPAIREKALELVDGNEFAAMMLTECVVGQPLANCAPGQNLWLIEKKSDCRSLSETIAIFASRWVVPLLQETTTIDEYVSAFERKDERIIWFRDRSIYTVSAYLLKDEYEKASEVMNRAYGATALRKHYEDIFEKVSLAKKRKLS